MVGAGVDIANRGSEPVAEGDGGTVYVIATSDDGTREALEAATALARGLSGRVVLFLQRGFHSPKTDMEADAAEAALRRLIDSYTPRPSVLSCNSQQPIDVVQLVQAPGLVVIGGEARLWWPTAEQRLARAFTRLGCHVTFVHVPHRRFVSSLPAEAR
jgi:hypothetical protein